MSVETAEPAGMRVLLFVCIFWSNVACADLCLGRYDPATKLIEAGYTRYGTLYSGGPYYNSVGPALEIYRLLKGLPDSGMAKDRRWDALFIDPGGDLTDPEFADETLTRSLARVHDPLFRRDLPDGRSYDVEILLNVLTPIGPFPGWWLAPNAPHLSEVEWVIATHAKDDALDWLLTIQSASTRPHTLSWTLQSGFRDGKSAPMRAVFAHSLRKYADSDDLAWLIAALMTREDHRWEWRLTSRETGALEAIQARMADLTNAVTSCSASQAEFIAFAIGAYDSIRFIESKSYSREEIDFAIAEQMPDILRRMAAVQVAKIDVVDRFGRKFDPETLRRLANDKAFDSWLNVGLSYRSDNLEALTELNKGVPLDPKTMRLLNILSVDDLLKFARSRIDFQRERRVLTTFAFLRYFALGRDEAAADMFEEVAALWPDREDRLRQAWSRNGALGYRLAQVALSLPEARVLLVPYWDSWSNRGDFEDTQQTDHDLEFWSYTRRSRDLPIAIRTGGYLARDFRRWMETVGSDPYATYAVKRRAYARGQTLPDVLTGTYGILPERTEIYHRETLGPAAFAGWDELERLRPETGLANRIGQELIKNARAKTAWPFRGVFADRERLAREMALVIEQGRRMIQGNMEGRPLGQRAFEVLHGPLHGTQEAADTPYWYICRERCEP